MRDPVNRLILVLAFVYMLGVVTGVKVADMLDRPYTAAEIAAELRLT